jgi:UDP-N-acetyl-2-amino-2-deoxyglucuronate dehydrogenase
MIGIGVIGFGAVGKRHVGVIKNNNHFKLLGVCDIKSERRNDPSLSGVEFFTDYNDLIRNKDIEIVSVCVPNYLHAPTTIAALNANRHVICEKPMAITVGECRKMIDASLKNNKKLFIVKQNRYNPPVARLKKVIDEGGIGTISQVVVNCYWNRNEKYYKNSDWKGDKAKDGGSLYTQFSHFVDLVIWLVGDVSSVRAFVSNAQHPYINTDDCGVAICKFENGAIGSINYSNNSYKQNMEGSITIFGNKGTVKIGGKYLNELEYQQFEGPAITDVPMSAGPNDYGDYQGSMSNHHIVYENVYENLRGSSKIDVSGIEGMKTVEVIEKIYQCSEERRAINSL